jgi:hypothetical protein
LWQLDLEKGSKREIATTGTGDLFWQLDDLDLNRKTMLFSKVHAARKEIVMFE